MLDPDILSVIYKKSLASNQMIADIKKIIYV
jgi:hypothetical protein